MSFAAKRIVRILPPYYLAIAFFIAFSFVLVHFGIREAKLNPISWVAVVKNLLFIDATGDYLNYSFWTLAVELRWYVAFPALLWLWCRSPKAFATVGVICALAWFTRAYSMDVSVLPAFMLGIVAADMRVREYRLPVLAFPVLLSIVALGISQEAVAVRPSLTWQIAAFLFVSLGGQYSITRNALSVKALTVIGVASYSIYLVHAPIIATLADVGIAPLIAGILAIGTGFLFWSIAERPFSTDPLRQTFVTWARGQFARALPIIGIPTRLELTDPLMQATRIVRSMEPTSR